MKISTKAGLLLFVFLVMISNLLAESEPVTSVNMEVRSESHEKTNLATQIAQINPEQLRGYPDISQERMSPQPPIPVWEYLANLSASEKDNARIRVQLPGEPSASIQATIQKIEQAWETGNHSTALNQLQLFAQTPDGQNAIFGIEWKNPPDTRRPAWGNDIQISSRKETMVTCLDYDKDTGHLLAVIKRKNSWTVNISKNGGETWQETYQGYNNRSTQINTITAAVLRNNFYVIFSDGVNQERATACRFSVNNGNIDHGYGFIKIFDENSAIKEMKLATNQDQHSDGLYLISILENHGVHYHYGGKAADWKSWDASGELFNDASRGLDVCYNKYPGFFMFVSYISTNNKLTIARKKSGGWEHGQFQNLPTLSQSNKITSISAWEDNVIVAFELDYLSGPGICCLLTDDGSGNTWLKYDVAKPTGNTSFHQPAVAARNGGGYALSFIEEAGSFDRVWFTHRNYATGMSWRNPVQINETEVFANLPLSMEWIPPKGDQDKAYGVIWIQEPDGHAYFDRLDAVGPVYPTRITVKSPNGGETWIVGNTYDIVWESDQYVGQVKIELYNNTSMSWKHIATTPHDGKYAYTPVEADISAKCSVRISHIDRPTVKDQSDSWFKIEKGQGDIAVTPNPFNYASVVLGQTSLNTFEISNQGNKNLKINSLSFVGTDAADFYIEQGNTPPFVIKPGQKTNLVIAFKPSSLGEKSASLSIASDDPDESIYLVNLKGKGVGEPDISIDPDHHDYGSIVLYQHLDKTFKIMNKGVITLKVTSVKLVGDHTDQFKFRSGYGAFNLDPGASHSLVVRFQPTSKGQKNARIEFRSNDPDEDPRYVNLTGKGYGDPDISVSPSSHDYGTVYLGSYENHTFKIKNLGQLDLKVSSVSVVGDAPSHFSIRSGGDHFTITPGNTRNLVVRFKPGSTGEKKAKIQIRSNDPNEDPKYIPIQGTGARKAPDIYASPSSHDFGIIKINEYADKNFTIGNNGNSNLVVSSTTLTGADASAFKIISGGGAYTLNPGHTRTLKIRFKPEKIGDKYAKVKLSTNDPDEDPFYIELKGEGGQLEPKWKAPITVCGSNGVTIHLNFGGDKDATDGFDNGLDVPVPPGFTYNAYFAISGAVNSLSTDIRKWVSPYETDVTWKLAIEKASIYPRITSTIKWDPDDLPDVDGIFRLVGAGLNVNMRENTSAQVEGDVLLEIQFRAKNIDTQTYTFSHPGWYLISLPVKPDDNRLSKLFPTSPSAYTYDPVSRTYVGVSKLDPEIGYWLLIPAATTAQITGEIVEKYTRKYKPGWHMIGSVFCKADFTDPNDDPNHSVVSAHGWDSLNRLYTTVYPGGTGKLHPGAGYWIAVIQECHLTIGSCSALGKAAEGLAVNLTTFYQEYGDQPPIPPFIAEQPTAELPKENAISRNYPNPFNAGTTISYSLTQAGLVQLAVYNSLGQKVRSLVDSEQAAGVHQVSWNGRDEMGEWVPSGIYFYTIKTAEFSETKKMLLVK